MCLLVFVAQLASTVSVGLQASITVGRSGPVRSGPVLFLFPAVACALLPGRRPVLARCRQGAVQLFAIRVGLDEVLTGIGPVHARAACDCGGAHPQHQLLLQ